MADSLSKLMAHHVRDLLDAVPAGIFISDISGRTLYINRMYEHLTGLKLDDIKGKNVRSLVEDGVFDLALNPEIVATGKSIAKVQNLKNGNKLVLSGTPVFDHYGTIVMVVTFARDITLLSDLQDQVEEQKRLIERISGKLAHLASMDSPGRPVFASPAMRHAMDIMERFARSDATVCILGETGVGKEVFARLLHNLSSRRDKPILKIDCGSIPESLCEAELFGYMPGAFTGASSHGKAGYFELAEDSTLFLDEIGELPLHLQTRLLRTLQDGEIVRVGASAPRKVNARIVAATNRDLAKAVEQGTFRSDLYYRLNVATLKIPPLRERVEDIRPLAEHFLRQYTRKYRKALAFMDISIDALSAYSWPGNVRELENLIHSLVITLNGPLISPSDLPASITSRSSRGCADQIFTTRRPLKEIIAEMEREFLGRALEIHGSVHKVAEMFSVDRTTIFRKLKKARS